MWWRNRLTRNLVIFVGIPTAAFGIGQSRSQKQLFTAEDVADITAQESDPRILVTFKQSVLDVSAFRHVHPGGAYIMDAAGGPIDYFVTYWGKHLLSEKFHALVETLKVGELASEDYCEEVKGVWADEPWDQRPPSAHVPYRLAPFCSQTKPTVLASSFLTPNNAFYVRNHAPVPRLPIDEHAITIYASNGKGIKVQANITVAELRNEFQQVSVIAAMQCAGNRENETGCVEGSKIEATMVGNAKWSGPRFQDVVDRLLPGVDSSENIIFRGADGYESSTPAHAAVDAVLAIDMNDEPLPLDHGSPVRVFIAGVAGARNVKWLSDISLSAQESSSCWQKYYYRHKGRSIQHVPAQCIILTVTWRSPELVDVVGVAWPHKDISTVEVSTDTHKWYKVNTMVPPVTEDYAPWAWCQWKARITVPKGSSNSKVFCRAIFSDGTTQARYPAVKSPYLYNGWHSAELGQQST